MKRRGTKCVVIRITVSLSHLGVVSSCKHTHKVAISLAVVSAHVALDKAHVALDKAHVALD